VRPRTLLMTTAIVVLVAAAFGALGFAETEVLIVDADEFDEALDKVLARDEFAWRLGPRASLDTSYPSWLEWFFDESFSALEGAFETVADWFQRLEAWLRKLTEPIDGPNGAGVAGTGISISWVLLILALAVVCSVLVVFLKRSRRTREEIDVETEPVELSELADDESAAGSVEPSRWRRWALELESDGRLREAIRAIHLATLSALAHAELIRLERFKSNLEYLRELRRRSRMEPLLAGLFATNIGYFERVWYGRDLATADLLHASLDNLDRIDSHVANSR
jgi:Domain of unknown function (DUF4129)